MSFFTGVILGALAGAIVAGFIVGLFLDRERWARRLADQRLVEVGKVLTTVNERWDKHEAALRAQHAAELERLNNVWTVQALEARKAKVIPAPPDAESRMLELVARDEAQAAAKAIERGVEKIMADERAAGRPCSRAEAELVAKSMFASAMGGAGGMG